MRSRSAQFKIIHNFAHVLVIKDIGPWDRYLTVTNDAESVVKRLVAAGHLTCGQQLVCIDSEGEADQLLVKDGKFSGFATVPPGMIPDA